MKISIEIFKKLKAAKNSAYGDIKPYFLFHSNKMEGSTFNLEELSELVNTHNVEGNHSIDDVYETINSLDVFDYVIDTLGEKIDHEFLITLNSKMLKNTSMDKEGLVGGYKQIPNKIHNSSIEVAMPKDVKAGIDDLLTSWENSNKQLDDIVRFHSRFEHIHPFQDGNGRVGRFLILKQCIENDIDLVFIDSKNEKPYKAWLEVAQTQNEFGPLLQLFIDSQKQLEQEFDKMGILRLLPDEPNQTESATDRAKAVSSAENVGRTSKDIKIDKNERE